MPVAGAAPAAFDGPRTAALADGARDAGKSLRPADATSIAVGELAAALEPRLAASFRCEAHGAQRQPKPAVAGQSHRPRPPHGGAPRRAIRSIASGGALAAATEPGAIAALGAYVECRQPARHARAWLRHREDGSRPHLA